MKLIFLLAALTLAVSNDVEENAAELAQKDVFIKVAAQQPVKSHDRLVNEEEFTSIREATQSGLQELSFGNNAYVLPPVPNSQPVPVGVAYAVAPAPIVAPPAAASQVMMPMPYSFQYAVRDDAKDLKFGHQADSDGNVVIGSYYVLLPDGRLQTVNYRADDDGYVAKVTYDDDDDDDDSWPGKLQSAAFAQQQANQQGQQSGGYGVPVPEPTPFRPPTVYGPSPVPAYQTAPPISAQQQSAYPVNPAKSSIPTSSSQVTASSTSAATSSTSLPSASTNAHASATASISTSAATSAASSSATSSNNSSFAQSSQTATTSQSTITQQGSTLTLQIPSPTLVQVSSSAGQTTSNVQNTQPGTTLTVQTSLSPTVQVNRVSTQNTEETAVLTSQKSSSTAAQLNISSVQNAQQVAAPTTQAPRQQSTNQSINTQQNVQATLTIQAQPVPAAQLNSQLSINVPPPVSTTIRPPNPTTSSSQVGVSLSVTSLGEQTQVPVADQPAVTIASQVQELQVGPTRPQVVSPTQVPVLSVPTPSTTSRPVLTQATPSASLGLLQLQLCASCPPRFRPDAQLSLSAPANAPVQQTPSIAPASTSSVTPASQPNLSQNAPPLNQPTWSQNVQPGNQATWSQSIPTSSGYSLPPPSSTY